MLDGSALTWFMNLQTRAERESRELTLQQVFDAFVKTYEGGLSQRLGEQELNSLTYLKGRCKDLNATDNEFDRLAQELYPGAEESPAAVALLARCYSEIIRRGDEALWEKAMDAQPHTVDEWKAAVQNAYTIMEAKAAATRYSRGRRDFRPSFSSTSSSSTNPSRGVSVRVNRMQGEAEGDQEESEAWERREGEAEPHEEQLQQLHARKGGGRSKSTAKSSAETGQRRWGAHLSYDERTQLMRAGKCWTCCQPGHMASACPKQGKDGYPRKPTEEELKA